MHRLIRAFHGPTGYEKKNFHNAAQYEWLLKNGIYCIYARGLCSSQQGQRVIFWYLLCNQLDMVTSDVCHSSYTLVISIGQFLTAALLYWKTARTNRIMWVKFYGVRVVDVLPVTKKLKYHSQIILEKCYWKINFNCHILNLISVFSSLNYSPFAYKI